MENQETPKKKWNILTRLLALIATAALMLGGLFLVVNRDQYNLDALKRRMELRKVETSATGEAAPFIHGGGEKTAVECLEDGIIMTSSAGIHYYTFSGDQYTERVTPMEFPVLSANGSWAAAYEAGGNSVYLYHGGQEARTIELPAGGSLLSARPNDSGWMAVTAQQSGFKGTVTVYDSEGEPAFRLNRSTTFITDAALSPDCRSVAAITMNQEGGAFESQLVVYRLNKEEPVAQVSLGGMAALDMDYENDRIWVLGDNAVSVISTQDWSVNTFRFGRSFLKGFSLGGDGFALVLLGRYRAGAADRAVTVGPDGQLTGDITLQGQTLDCDAAGRYVSILNGGELNLYTKDLAPYRTLDDTQGARYTAMAPNGSALLADRQQAWLYIPD